MLPEIEIGDFSIETFTLMILVAYVASVVLVGKRLHELGKPPQWAQEGVFVALAGGILGATVYAMVDRGAGFDLGALLEGSGMVWYGGLIGGAVSTVLWSRWRGIGLLALLDLAAPALALSQAIGRVGCQLSGDGDYGVESELPWAMSYEDGTIPTPPGVTVHPTPIYEALALSLVAWLLWRWRDRYRPGVLFALYLVLAGAQRLLVEFVRRNPDVIAGLTTAQLISVGLIAVGLGWLVIERRRAVGHSI